eukprot:CAMPEP_0174266632 /NCGR_PEP_ID=MMETSP0439-20130205/30930_1 /TAXON_ID=0 /ORGANISM="Stereomyxa ramosa, Strain Chinc5" /LENGTH=195 /DNA_ID=CAMNT_0015353715 /DNA_START=16 /DNA_END=603 /DNA_ORIENTATION=+
MNGIKCVLVGDSKVGKTALVKTYTENSFPTAIPTVADNCTVQVQHKGKTLSVALWDTAGLEDYSRLRPLAYPSTDVFLLCFSVANPSSLLNVESSWDPEVSHHNPCTPKVLVGMKIDLRNDEETNKMLEKRQQRPVCRAQGEAMAEKIGARYYLEVSSLSSQGLQQVFDTVVLAAVGPGPSLPNTHSKTRQCLLC